MAIWLISHHNFDKSNFWKTEKAKSQSDANWIVFMKTAACCATQA